MVEVLDLSIVIVSWNVADLLAQCLDSIYKSPVRITNPTRQIITNIQHDYPTVEVIVVDSASQDSSVAMLREKYEWVRLMAESKNIGFVRGNNLGLAQAQGQNLMLLNPDTEIVDDALPQLLALLNSDLEIGIVGPHTLNGDQSHQSTRRRFPTLKTAIFESTWLEGFAPAKLLEDFRVRDLPDNGTYPVDWVQGSALMLKRAIYDELGGLDELYIMYAEEMDWCKRAQNAGWQVYYLGSAYVIHYSGQSTAQVQTRSQVHFQHSKLRYFQKYHGWFTAFILRIVLLGNYAVQLGLESTKWLIGHKRPLRAERIKAYWIVIRSLLGAGEKIVLKTT